MASLLFFIEILFISREELCFQDFGRRRLWGIICIYLYLYFIPFRIKCGCKCFIFEALIFDQGSKLEIIA